MVSLSLSEQTLWRVAVSQGGGQNSMALGARTGGADSYKKRSTSIEKAQLSLVLQRWLCHGPFQAARISR